jgi:hypothetical protein
MSLYAINIYYIIDCQIISVMLRLTECWVFDIVEKIVMEIVIA